jgi:hypothetical protein
MVSKNSRLQSTILRRFHFNRIDEHNDENKVQEGAGPGGDTL